MATAAKTARVKMLGNHLEYEAGKEYDLPLETVNQLTGIGFAVVIADKPAKEQQDAV